MTANPPSEPGSSPPLPQSAGRSLGDEADYHRWIRDAASRGEQAPRAPSSGTGPERSPSRTRHFDDLVLVQSSLAESSLVALSRSTIPGMVGAAARPVWSDHHQAWLVRDRRVGRWYRHDADDDRWVPLDG